jgi:tetratricopeptide (TPR) repeat protein
MWTPRWLSQRFLARILGALASFCRFAFGGIKAIITFLERTFKFIALSVPVSILVFVLVYFYPRVSRDVLIIDSFSVPKQFEEAGFTPDVVANQIFNTMQEINADAHAQIEKDEVTWARDEGSIPDVEVPGTKLGIKTFLEMARAIPGAHKARHVIGDIVALQTGGLSVGSQITVTIYFKDDQGSHIRFVPKANDIDSLTREIAEKIWEQIKPFVLASYQYEHHNPEEALKLARRIIADEPPDNSQVAAAYALIGKILSEQRSYDEAFANLNKSIELNSKSPFPYIVWGNALASQGNEHAHQGDKRAAETKYDGAIEQYKKANEINPKSPVPYDNWGNTLRYWSKMLRDMKDQGAEKKQESAAAAMYQEAIKKDRKFVQAYNNWGLLFSLQNNYPEAIEKYQRANDIDPRHANHKWWGRALFAEKKYDEAIAQFQKAVEIDPRAVNGYNGWGDVLAAEKKYDEAIEQYKKTIAIDPNNAEAYEGWGNALREQGKRKAAEEKFARANELD